MTRRGSLAYYLAAWVIGCFVVSIGPWVRGMRMANSGISSNLLFIYFIALVVGAVDLLLYAFLLRIVMRWCKTHALWIWFLAGMSVAYIMTTLLAWGERTWHRVPAREQGGFIIVYRGVFAAPLVLRDSGPWVILLDGAVMGVILCLVDRAFSQTPETPLPPAN